MTRTEKIIVVIIFATLAAAGFCLVTIIDAVRESGIRISIEQCDSAKTQIICKGSDSK